MQENTLSIGMSDLTCSSEVSGPPSHSVQHKFDNMYVLHGAEQHIHGQQLMNGSTVEVVVLHISFGIPAG